MIAVCLKWVDQRPEGSSTGQPEPDSRFAGVSGADRAALEWALRCGEAWPDQTVVAFSVGPLPADAVLRDALAVGASRAVRIEASFAAPSRFVARCLAAEISAVAEISAGADGQNLVICGDYSLDRGTGSVPAFLAAELGYAQALGLVGLTIDRANDHSANDPGSNDHGANDHGSAISIEALRRVDGGRRDRLAIRAPAVISVEGSTALLRRAPLRGLLDQRPIEVVTPALAPEHPTTGTSRPFRPRPRMLAAPIGPTALDRVKVLTASGTAAAVHGDAITLDPQAAADRILDALAQWSYLQP